MKTHVLRKFPTMPSKLKASNELDTIEFMSTRSERKKEPNRLADVEELIDLTRNV